VAERYVDSVTHTISRRFSQQLPAGRAAGRGYRIGKEHPTAVESAPPAPQVLAELLEAENR
jgi:hypothetical protein